MTTTPPPPTGPPPAVPTSSKKSATEQTGTAPKLGKKTPEAKPPRIILNAVEGWGKTSMGAYAPEPAILQARGETGYEVLLGNGLVPSVDTARIDDWLGLLALLRSDLDGIKTIVLDALGGIERLCHEFVCDREYDGDFGEKGFTSYQKGYDVAIGEWLNLLVALDKQWDSGKAIVVLSHCKVKSFKNPLGADFDRYISDVHEKTWAATNKWADYVFFGNFFSVVETANKSKPEALRHGKGIGATQRVVYTERRDAFDAKNRSSMSPVLDIPNDPKQIWATINNEITRKKG